MSEALLSAVEVADTALADALDALDADAIHHATEALSSAVVALGNRGGEPLATTGNQPDALASRISGLRRRVNLLADQARGDVEALTLAGARVAPTT